MNVKKTITYLILAILVVDVVVFLGFQLQHTNNNLAKNSAQSAAVKKIDSTVVVDGSVTAQDQATLHFQVGGKLVSVPLKEGDKVTQGQIIAQLDSYALQRMLSVALNTYKSTRDSFDQTQQSNSNKFTQNEQSTALNVAGADAGKYGVSNSATDYINQVAQRIGDESQASLDTSVANVEIANYAMQMATLTSPLTGIVTHEDVNVAGQNVTPSTSFVVADPTTKVFRANVPATDIDYISEGMNASVILDGVQERINGTIVKVYPSKTTLSDGEQVYQVDIQSDQIKSSGKLDQGGTAIIMTNAQDVTLIPAWTVLSGKYVWVINNDKPVLRTITVGKTHGAEIEVTNGLSSGDRVITDPKMIPSKEYPLL